ncbi:major facilitator superfamily domain-containing protein [Cokeromyces recurvatus]|uniref:major facilitator superfamily domain-containing protein n=1 Tax=Cokeromyces recurvatus TaxID=90255 RepID=UPI00221F0256|nr:major facilitator superfamily domain-containing protein [Cokeromyces recurvatus]KAI7899845.1 major facilitator superfamily domain-containing protein [Cokeromyces recurvatus]
MYIICKLLYIAIFSLLSAAPPYFSLYFHNVLQFSSDQIGFILAIAPFIQSIACPIWSYIVDKHSALHGPIMAITSLLGGSGIMSIMVIGHSVSSEEVIPQTFIGLLSSLQLSKSMSFTLTSCFTLAFAFFTLPNISLVDSAVMKILGPNKILYGEQRLWGSISAGLTILIVGQLLSFTNNFDVLFYVFGVGTIFFMIFSCYVNVNQYYMSSIPESSLRESSLLEAAPNHHTLHHSNALARDSSEKPLLGGNNSHMLPANTYNSISSDVNNGHQYVELFKSSSIASSGHNTIREEADNTLDALGYPDLGLSISRIASVDPSIVDGLKNIHTEGLPTAKNAIRSIRVLTFLTTALFFGLVLSIIVNFLFLFLSQDLHMPASWIGWTGLVTGITELLSFCFSKQLTEKFGVTKMIFIAHLATIIRCLAYTILKPDSYITNVCALSLQAFHGIGFGIFWATAVNEVDGFFPPEQRSVAQGILGALHFGLGAGLGALVGGYMYEYLGPVYMFQIAAGMAVLNLAVFYIGRLDKFK